MERKKPDDTFLRPREVADRLGVRIGIVLGWIHSGELAAANCAARAGRRPRWRIDPAEVERFLLSRSAPKPARASANPRVRHASAAEYRRWGL